MAETTLKVIVVDNDPIVRRIITKMIDRHDFLEVVATLDNGAQAVEFCLAKPVDAVLMDIGMPVMDGVTACDRIKKANPQIRIVMLSSYDWQAFESSVSSSGPDAFLPKSAEIEAIEAALLSTPVENVTRPQGDLTNRESQVLDLVCQGLTNHQIARRLGVSDATIKAHVSSCMRKTMSQSRTQLSAWAFSHL